MGVFFAVQPTAFTACSLHALKKRQQSIPFGFEDYDEDSVHKSPNNRSVNPNILYDIANDFGRFGDSGFEGWKHNE
jgi:hypothetical protein